MKNLLSNRWFLLILRLIVGGIFLYAGISKLTHPQAFADSIETFKLLPTQFINLSAMTLAPLEIIVACLMIVGLQKRVASFAAFILTIIFALGLAQGLARGLVLDCGCFGSGIPSTAKTWISLWRDLLLGTATFVIYFHVKPR